MGETQPTEYGEVVTMFHSMPKCKEVLSYELERQYFLAALAEYELDIGKLNFDTYMERFDTCLEWSQIYTLALMMYVRYLRQELSRTLKLNGLSGKDVQLTGASAGKQYTYAELQSEMLETQRLLYKQKQHCFN